MYQRFIYHTYRLSLGLAYWIQKRFTKAGWLALSGLVASAIFGLDTNLTMAFQIFTFLIALLSASAAYSLFFKGRFSAQRSLPRFATAGIPFTYSIRIQNLTSATHSDLVVFENMTDPRPTLSEFLRSPPPQKTEVHWLDRWLGVSQWNQLVLKQTLATAKEHPLPPLPPHAQIDFPLQLIPQRRGNLRLTGMTLARPDPFGLFKAFFRVPVQDSLLVLPKRYALPPIHLPGSHVYQPGGVTLASSVGESEEFVSLRDYRPGDPLRHIHWKSRARTGRLITKEYQDEFFVRHALILDTFTRIENHAAFEEAVSIAASFASTISTQDSILDLIFVGPQAFCFTAGRGLAHVDQMLEILASVDICTNRAFRSLRETVLQHAPVVTGCICVFLEWNDERKQLVESLQSLGVPLQVLVVVDSKPNNPDPGPMKNDPGHFHWALTGKVEEALARL